MSNIGLKNSIHWQNNSGTGTELCNFQREKKNKIIFWSTYIYFMWRKKKGGQMSTQSNLCSKSLFLCCVRRNKWGRKTNQNQSARKMCSKNNVYILISPSIVKSFIYVHFISENGFAIRSVFIFYVVYVYGIVQVIIFFSYFFSLYFPLHLFFQLGSLVA